jgi:hypothetical protein
MIDRVRVKGKSNATTVYEIFDGDPEELFQLKIQTQPAFSEGMELYLKRNFTEACKAFEAVHRKNPQDKAAELYLERCKSSIENGVSESWSGIENLGSKFE